MHPCIGHIKNGLSQCQAGIHAELTQSSKMVSKNTQRYKSLADLTNKKMEMTPTNLTVIFRTVILRKSSILKEPEMSESPFETKLSSKIQYRVLHRRKRQAQQDIEQDGQDTRSLPAGGINPQNSFWMSLRCPEISLVPQLAAPKGRKG